MLPHKSILLGSIFLLLLISSIVSAQDGDEAESPEESEDSESIAEQRITGSTTQPSTTKPLTTQQTTTQQTTTRTQRTRTTTYNYPFTPYEPRTNKYRKGSNRHRYRDDDQYGDRAEYREVGRDGQHPGEYGQDYVDFGPVYDNQESMYASMNIWIRAADDWEQRGQSKYNKRYGGKKYRKGKERDDDDDKYNKDRDYDRKDNKDKEYDDKDKDREYGNRDKEYNGRDKEYDGKDKYDNDNDDNDYDYKKNDRKKRSYSRVKFPVRHFKDIRRFPHKSFPPLLSIMPWLPIFYDRITYQTFIFSPTGGIYILPPLINFYGQRFAVAQLIKWGYASLVSSGTPPPPNINVAPLVQPVPVSPPVAGGVPGAAAPPGRVPTYDTKKNRFTGGVKTDFPDFKPRYASTFEENSYGNNRGVNRNTYGADANYGGTGRQEVYPQGGPRGGGSGGGTGRQEVYPQGGPRGGGSGGGYNY